MAGGRPGRPIGGIRALFCYKIFVSAVFTLLFLAALSVLLTTYHHRRSSSDASTQLNAESSGDLRRTFLALNSDPLRTRLDLIYRQASDHLALVHAYAAYARRLKLDNARQLRVFEDLAASLSAVAARLGPDAPITDEESLRPLEKEAKDRIKIARQLISESKESFDTQLKIQKLRDTIFAAGEQLNKAQKLGAISSQIAAVSTPKSLHCLAMRLMEEHVAHPELYSLDLPADLDDTDLYHFAIFSDNVIAVSVVIGSVVHNAEDPGRHVFHVVTDQMYLAAMRVWFTRRPPAGGARVEVKSVAEFGFVNASYSPLVRQIEGGKRKDLALLDHLRFYLPEMYPSLRRIVYLEDDVVAQKDLAGLWKVDLDGRVNGAVEICFGGFRRYNRYMNFSHPLVRDRFSPRACAWAYGVNVFDLDAWRRERCTEQFHEYQSMNEDGTLWPPESVLSAGLMTFYMKTKPLDKSWNVMGLGYNPSVSPDMIRNAAAIHFNGNMKPWLDIALNQYKHLWTKYVDTEMEFLQLCNFGI